jgi:hypothetical protein
MKRVILQASLGLLLLVCTKASLAQTYYVDNTKATNGDGSFANPWNNLASAIYGPATSGTSDVVVYFRQGTYYLNGVDSLIYIPSTRGGSGGHYFILRAYPGETVVFDGSRLKTAFGALASIAGASYVRFQGLTFANLQNVTAYGIYISGGGTNIDIRDCIFRNMLWNSDTAEAKFPTTSDPYISPIIVVGSGSLPAGVLIDSNRFVTIATGYYGNLVSTSGSVGTVTQTANVDSNVIAEGPRYQFYVSTGGSDTTGNGSKAKPYRTINFAVNGAGYDFSTTPPVLLDSNITIYLRGGIYYLTNPVYIGHNRGINGKSFTITNYDSEWVAVDGGNLTQKYSCIFIVDSASHVTIQNLDIRNLTDDSTLTQNGVKDVRYGIIIEGTSSYISILNNDLYNMQWTKDTTKARNPTGTDVLSAITVLGASNTPITNLLIHENTVHNIVPGYAEGVTVNGNVDSFEISDNEVYDVANIGIVAAGNYAWVLASYPSLLKANNQSRNGLIKDNTVYRCISPIALSAGIYLDGSRNVKVQGNESYNNGVGISVGNESDSSSSGGHTVISNDIWANLESGIYLGSTNLSSIVDTVVVKYNTFTNDYTIDPTLYNRANGRYGVLDSSAMGPEIVMNRIRHLTFDENDIYSASDNVLEFAYSQSNLVFTYNDYYTRHNNPCKAWFLRDTVGNGLAFKTDTTFNQYASETLLDTTSYLGGVAYDRHGCGTHSSAAARTALTGLAASMGQGADSLYEYPNPVTNGLFVRINSLTGGPVNVELLDMSGKVLLRQDRQLIAGINELGWSDVKRHGLAQGLYLVRVITPVGKAIVKVIVH